MQMSSDELSAMIHNAAAGGSGQPYMYGQSQGPQSSQLASTIVNMVGPMLSNYMSSVSSVGGPGGVSPFFRNYQKEVTQPLYNQGQAEFTSAMGAGFAREMGRAMSSIGADRALGIRPGATEASMINGDLAGAIRLLASTIGSSPGLQRAMGGNPMAMQDILMGSRHDLATRPGAFIDPMDIGGQTLVAQHATDYSKSLMYAIRGHEMPDGTTSVGLPNMAFTQGLTDQGIGMIASTAARRGNEVMSGMFEPGSDPTGGLTQEKFTQMNAHVQKFNMLFRQLGEIMGTINPGELIPIMDKIEQNWARLTPGELVKRTDDLRTVQATASVLGMSGKDLMVQNMAIQQMGHTIAGVSPDMQSMGVGGGVEASLSFANGISTRAKILERTMGYSPEAAIGRTVAAYEIGRNSPQGQDLRQIAMLAQEGQISPEEYQSAIEIATTGTTGQKKAVADRILQRQYGSPEAGRMMRQRPGYEEYVRKYLRADLQDPIAKAQANEAMQRIPEYIADEARQNLRQASYVTGVNMLPPPAIMARANMEALKTTSDISIAHATATIADPQTTAEDRVKAAKTRDTVQEFKRTALAEYDRNLALTGNAPRAYQTTVSELRGSGMYDTIMGEVEQRQHTMMPTVALAAMQDSEELAGVRGGTVQMRELARNDPVMRQQLSGIQDLTRQYNTAQRTGDVAAQNNTREQLKTKYEGIKATFSGDHQRLIGGAEHMSREAFRNIKNRAVQGVAAQQMVQVAGAFRAYAVISDIVGQTSDLASGATNLNAMVPAGDGTQQTLRDSLTEQVKHLAVPQAERDRMMGYLNEGTSEGFKKFGDVYRGIRSQLRRSLTQGEKERLHLEGGTVDSQIVASADGGDVGPAIETARRLLRDANPAQISTEQQQTAEKALDSLTGRVRSGEKVTISEVENALPKDFRNVEMKPKDQPSGRDRDGKGGTMRITGTLRLTQDRYGNDQVEIINGVGSNDGNY